MEEKKPCFRLLFQERQNATEMQKKNKICAVDGEGDVIDGLCRKWFVKFGVEYFSLDDAPQLGRAVEVDSDPTETLTENNQCSTTGKTAVSWRCVSAQPCAI